MCCRELSQSEILAVHRCQSDPRGDLVTWQAGRWSLAGLATSQNIDYTQVVMMGRDGLTRTLSGPGVWV